MATSKQFRKRNAILEFLQHSKAHPSADMVFAGLKPQIPDLSLGTVYRNLAAFKAQGLISSLGTVGGVERFDANTHPHVHFVCGQCGQVEDLKQIPVPEHLEEAVKCQTGGAVTACQLTFTGICKGCLGEKSGESA